MKKILGQPAKGIVYNGPPFLPPGQEKDKEDESVLAVQHVRIEDPMNNPHVKKGDRLHLDNRSGSPLPEMSIIIVRVETRPLRGVFPP